MVFLDPRPKGGEGGVPVSPLAAKLQVCKNEKISELELWLRGGGSRRLGRGTRLGGAGRGYRRWFFGWAGGGSASGRAGGRAA